MDTDVTTVNLKPSIIITTAQLIIKKILRAIEISVLFIGAFANTAILLGAISAIALYTFSLIGGFYAAAFFRGVENYDMALLLQGYLGLIVLIGMIKAFIYMTK